MLGPCNHQPRGARRGHHRERGNTSSSHPDVAAVLTAALAHDDACELTGDLDLAYLDLVDIEALMTAAKDRVLYMRLQTEPGDVVSPLAVTAAVWSDGFLSGLQYAPALAAQRLN